MLKLWADFNEVEDKTIWTSLRQTRFVRDGEPWVGQRVAFWDYEGNVCQGIVTEIDYPIVYAELDLSTWVDGESVKIEPEYGTKTYSRSQGAEERTGVEEVEKVEVAVG